MIIGFLFGSKNFCKFLCFSLWSFCFARIHLDPLSVQILHHNCISVIVSRFAIVAWDLVICCYQTTEICGSKHGSAHCVFCTGPLWSWSSSRSRNFGLKGSEYEHCVYPNPHVSLYMLITASLSSNTYNWSFLTRRLDIWWKWINVFHHIDLLLRLMTNVNIIVRLPWSIWNLRDASKDRNN